MTRRPSKGRYNSMPYRRCGKSGLMLPAISLGLWQNFGDYKGERHKRNRKICRRAFDLGITHFDLANNYGPPPGDAERFFGSILKKDFKNHRDELIVSTKAGYRMWPGPYGEWGGRKYLVASCDQSLKRLGLDYVDIFYSHRFDPDTPLEETMAALDFIVRSGRALYAGLSSYNSARTKEAMAILRELKTPCVIHQPSYSMINRWIEEDGLPETLKELGMGCIVFSPLAQGMLSGRYLGGIPAGSRAAQGGSLKPEFLSEGNLQNITALDQIARRRGQSLARMAIAWVLRQSAVTSALIGVRKMEQLEDCVKALDGLEFTAEELSEIDRWAKEADINIWAASSERKGPSR